MYAFSPYRRSLETVSPSKRPEAGPTATVKARRTRTFLSLQHFGGAKPTLLYCGTTIHTGALLSESNPSGFTNKVWLAEAHHKLGLGMEGKEARKAKRKCFSLGHQTQHAGNSNNLARCTQLTQGQRARLSKTVTLRPNYPFPLQLAEPTNPESHGPPRRLFALVEGIR